IRNSLAVAGDHERERIEDRRIGTGVFRECERLGRRAASDVGDSERLGVILAAVHRTERPPPAVQHLAEGNGFVEDGRSTGTVISERDYLYVLGAIRQSMGRDF